MPLEPLVFGPQLLSSSTTPHEDTRTWAEVTDLRLLGEQVVTAARTAATSTIARASSPAQAVAPEQYTKKASKDVQGLFIVPLLTNGWVI